MGKLRLTARGRAVLDVLVFTALIGLPTLALSIWFLILLSDK